LSVKTLIQTFIFIYIDLYILCMWKINQLERATNYKLTTYQYVAFIAAHWWRPQSTAGGLSTLYTVTNCPRSDVVYQGG